MNIPRNKIQLLLLLFLLLPIMLQAQFTEPVSEEAAPVVPSVLKSPHATYSTFQDAIKAIKDGDDQRIEDAVATLDLSDINPMVRTERGAELAWLLVQALDKGGAVRLSRVPDATEGDSFVLKKYSSGTIQISRQGDGRWLFDKQTLANLPDLVLEINSTAREKGRSLDDSYLPWHMRLRQQLPESFLRTSFLLQNWQWLGLFLVVVVGIVADKMLSLLMQLLVKRWRNRNEHREFKAISDQILRPLGLMAMAVIWWVGLNLMGLPESVMLVLLVAVKFLASISGVWAAYRMVDLLTVRLASRARLTDNRLDDVLAPLIPRSLKVFVTIIGIVFIADNLNIDVTSLLAGLGLGGLAFALAAKDMVQNLFGSITVLMDRTFSVGDWIVVDGVEGSVENIGFRSTRVRTFYNSLVTVPNSKFITADVDNMGERSYRRLSCKLSLTYDTPPDRIEAFCEGARELIRQHPYMRKDYYQVYLNELGASSLDVLLYVFWQTPEWNTELRERHRFLLDILRLAKRLNVEFAFPTQTLYMRQEALSGVAVDVELSQQEALNHGRNEAVAIVKETLGDGPKPPPVTFPPAG
ncbi:MAG: mechanosensitive ion channel family protein [Gammaproteobacteria bacterium]|nr:mechanosensitive ion channel family protein [Gammaproteobacteria bacterium]